MKEGDKIHISILDVSSQVKMTNISGTIKSLIEFPDHIVTVLKDHCGNSHSIHIKTSDHDIYDDKEIYSWHMSENIRCYAEILNTLDKS